MGVTRRFFVLALKAFEKSILIHRHEKLVSLLAFPTILICICHKWRM
jgi:hypothetical protein